MIQQGDFETVVLFSRPKRLLHLLHWQAGSVALTPPESESVSHSVRSDSFVTLWTLLSMEISKSGLPFPSPGDLPNPGTESGSPALAGRFFTI